KDGGPVAERKSETTVFRAHMRGIDTSLFRGFSKPAQSLEIDAFARSRFCIDHLTVDELANPVAERIDRLGGKCFVHGRRRHDNYFSFCQLDGAADDAQAAIDRKDVAGHPG